MTGTKREWRYPCPKCGARVGETCTYLKDKQRWQGNTQIVLYRTGDPCVRSHNERLTYQQRKRRWTYPPIQGPSPAVRALWEYDRHEYHAMRAWLHANRNIFHLKEQHRDR